MEKGKAGLWENGLKCCVHGTLNSKNVSQDDNELRTTI